MPAYSFQERFVPMVLDGSKCQTIRKRRLKGYAKAQDPLYLYYGMRTSHCKLLRKEICEEALTIVITKDKGLYVLPERITESRACSMAALLTTLPITFRVYWENHEVVDYDEFAYEDGFRPPGTGLGYYNGCFDEMMKFWGATHELPFIGDLITWIPDLKNNKK